MAQTALDRSEPQAPGEPSAPIVWKALERVLSSRIFSSSERMKRFLRFSVEHSLEGRSSSVKEYAIALAVYDKPTSFDPRTDPIVRVEAIRLRSKLRQYYEIEGQADPIVISIQKTGYAAVFRHNRTHPA